MRTSSLLTVWLMIVALLAACTAPQRMGPGPVQKSGFELQQMPDGRLGPYRAIPLGDERVRLLEESARQELSQTVSLEEAYLALETMRQARLALNKQSIVQHTRWNDEPADWERRLWEEYAVRYGAERLPPVEEVANKRMRMALSLSPQYMAARVREAAQALFNDRVFITAVVASVVLYLGAWAAPEPFFSKSAAATVTLWLAMYFTVAELRLAGQVVWRLYKEAGQAHSLQELEAAAEHFGRAVGGVVLRVLIMVAGWGVGKALPPMMRGGGPGGASLAADSALAGELSAVSVEVMADGSLVAVGVGLGTSASTSRRGVCGEGGQDGSERHHIATVKNRASEVRGGPWTPRFEELFAEAGLSMEDPANTVFLQGHYGPHPEEYHRAVYERLRLAMRSCRNTESCQRLLKAELRRIADDICTPGTLLNRLITK